MFKAMDRVVILEASGSSYAGLFGFVDNVYEEDGQMIDARVWLEKTDGSTFTYYVGPHGAMLVEDGTPELLAESAASEQRMLDYKRAQRERDAQIEAARQLMRLPRRAGSARTGQGSAPSNTAPAPAERPQGQTIDTFMTQAQAAAMAALQAESDTYWAVDTPQTRPSLADMGTVQVQTTWSENPFE